jgi:hypothetical protein
VFTLLSLQPYDQCPASTDNFDVTVRCPPPVSVDIGVDVSLLWNGTAFVRDVSRYAVALPALVAAWLMLPWLPALVCRSPLFDCGSWHF